MDDIKEHDQRLNTFGFPNIRKVFIESIRRERDERNGFRITVEILREEQQPLLRRQNIKQPSDQTEVCTIHKHIHAKF